MARLLVVDDDVDVRDLVAMWVRAEGHQVTAVESGEAALELVSRQGMPDAALLDVDLPGGMDGIELLQRLRQARPGLPALFVTVLWTSKPVARMRATGVGHLTKPFTADALRTAVRKLLIAAPATVAAPDASAGAGVDAGQFEGEPDR